MTTFARARIDEDSLPIVECIYNRELMVPVKTDQMFFVMSEDVHNKFGVRSDLGEVLIYSPLFEEDYQCMWVGLSVDFDMFELEEITA